MLTLQVKIIKTEHHITKSTKGLRKEDCHSSIDPSFLLSSLK